MDDEAEDVADAWLCGWGHPTVGHASRPVLGFGVADPKEEPVRPSFELAGATQPADVAKDIEEGLPYRVLGDVWIGQDALGDAGQACMASDDQGPEGLLALLHPTDDPFVHVAPRA